MFADRLCCGLPETRSQVSSGRRSLLETRLLSKTKMADKKEDKQEYLEFFRRQWDRCIIDTAFKTIGGTVAGTVFSFLFFKRAAWPITLGAGVGLGAGYTNCKHQMWWRHLHYGGKHEGPDGHQGTPFGGRPSWGPPWGGPPGRWEKCPIRKEDKKAKPKPDQAEQDSEKSSQPADGEST